ncbi:hypothetical protein SN35N_2270 [Lactiplantibacillus plantarum]|nr:hypothetical protein [Lactiplantibacillus plantarum]BBA82649.1 hypothetical protein SN35N_2270 [Lactiplantibacillus plantarum]CDN27268.1 hypothetical protein predicted by Glimmer/Critica [Lactiplantibacillus plantarum]
MIKAFKSRNLKWRRIKISLLKWGTLRLMPNDEAEDGWLLIAGGNLIIDNLLVKVSEDA